MKIDPFVVTPLYSLWTGILFWVSGQYFTRSVYNRVRCYILMVGGTYDGESRRDASRALLPLSCSRATFFFFFFLSLFFLMLTCFLSFFFFYIFYPHALTMDKCTLARIPAKLCNQVHTTKFSFLSFSIFIVPHYSAIYSLFTRVFW